MATELAVIMAAYNSEKTINKAVSSITAGTYPCDIYIIDDCSRVPVSDVLGKIPNVEIIRLEKNQGPARASNVGLERILARSYKYVAKMDADDISYSDRLAKQVAFLDRHPNVAAVGTWGRHFDEQTGEVTIVNRTPAAPDAIRHAMYFNSPVINASSMIRADVFRALGPYSTDYPAAEDYELFRRIAAQYDLANLPEVLLDVRESVQGISLSRRRRQLFDRMRIQIRYFAPLQWRAWLGIAKTVLLFAVPRTIIAPIKIFFERLLFPLGKRPTIQISPPS
jgi:GT2 family glycosyltransferase